jgi:hypothetical protein
MMEVIRVSRQSSESFDEHERPTARRSRLDGDIDPNATMRIEPLDLEQLVAKGSGTRPVVTSVQIDRYRNVHPVETSPAAPADDAKDRETVDALTLQRETLIIEPPENVRTTLQQIPLDLDLDVDVDLSYLAMASPRAEQRRLILAGAFLLATISALLGFVAGRL